MILSALVIIALFLTLPRPELVKAESGLPNSAEFGYGIRLDLSGTQINPSISAVASLKFNWLAIDFNWASIWPARDASPELEPLNQAMLLATQNHLSVMISITEPPDWAVTPDGPDPTVSLQIVKYLVRTYPEVLLAIELFPGANTTRGWGTTPDPKAYLKLFKAAAQALKSESSPVILVPAGLTPLPTKAPKGDIDDLVFLDTLYSLGALDWMPIIGVRLPETTGDPLFTPGLEERRCLRHFEEVRQVMIDHNHREGLIWITGFSWPSGKIRTVDGVYKNVAEQTRWLNQAYQILKSQLYIGVAFFTQINPPGPHAAAPNPVSLINQDLSIHPALANLGVLISPLADNSQRTVQTVLTKRIVQDIQFKPPARNASVHP